MSSKMSLKSEPRTAREMTRIRPLSKLGHEQYESAVDRHLQKIRDIKREIDGCIDDIKLVKPSSKGCIDAFRQLLSSSYSAYVKRSSDFLAYLQGIRTAESLNEAAAHRCIMDAMSLKIEAAKTNLDELCNASDSKTYRQKDEQYSSKSRTAESTSSRQIHRKHSPSRSRSEKSSEISSELTKYSLSGSSSTYLQRVEAKLNASRAKLKYVAKEVIILKERAALDAQLKLVKAECEIEMREKEIEAMRETFKLDTEDPEMSSTRRSRTVEYVQSLPIPQLTNEPQNDTPPEVVQKVFAQETVKVNNSSNDHGKGTHLDPDAPSFTPSRLPPHRAQMITSSPVHAHDSDNRHNTCVVEDHVCDSPVTNASNQMTEFTKFLVKKDLLLSRLTRYDDNPMLYVSWKLNFKGIMKELDATATEELDLLVRWLGPASSRQANTIRACNADNSALAVQKIWERLEERFGSPEMLERSLKERITSFPRIAANDNRRLFDLADLVSEIASVKEQPQYRVLFGYFDSSTGINPIVSKLPWNLQEKWVTEASRFKRQQGSTFPPFSVFVKFVQDMAKTRNDPSFQFDRTERTSPSSSVPKKTSTVVVKKTDTMSNATNQDNSQLCPLHQTKHLLNECSAFRRKPLEERKKFILTNGICFKCCGPKKHRAMNCKTNVKCDICKKPSHPSALHVDVDRHVGEPSQEGTVKNACTQVCGKPRGTSRSCAKIIPVRVYLKDDPQECRVVYALIDDQSSHSLATTPFFDFFSPGSSKHQYVLSSCAGRLTTSGRRGHGYVIESLDLTCKLELPSVIECNDIPNNRDEIPFPAVARQYPHLQEIAAFIPTVMDDVEIELLIGRDVVSTHHVLDQKLGENNLPIAQRLSLGWVIIGQVCMGNLHHASVTLKMMLNVLIYKSIGTSAGEFYIGIILTKGILGIY
ncbi:uncharacterized protein LOC134280770 [Saccostrea cucullata]|uniref:uncharacterized protein LOC134280770 n=1 Tax=Saccostrea cuccullata TaxID=36930 RepID=UPI002ED06EE0